MQEFQQALDGLSRETASIILRETPERLRDSIREIRLRSGRPICLVTSEGDYFLKHTIWQGELFECFRALCGYSVHSHEEEIRQGYLTIRGGHRAGLCGTAVYAKGEVVNIRNISSINLRIARQVFGVADQFIKQLHGQPERSIIVGAPGSGKTTLLKDLVRQVSKTKKVVVVDSRGEIAACSNGVPQNDLGYADILDGWKKSDGMMNAIRTMGPEIIVCDEIGDQQDAVAVEVCLNAGVSVIATAHAGSLEELSKRKHIMDMLSLNAFDQIVLLEGKQSPCNIHAIVKAGEFNASYRSVIDCNLPSANR